MARRLNIKLIVLFITALWLFAKGGEVLGYLRNPALAEQIKRAKGDTAALSGEGVTVVSIVDFALAPALASIAGLLVAFVIALLICKKRKWHWLNPAIALIFLYLMGWVETDGLNYIVQLLRLPGNSFSGIWYYIINGLVSISLGLVTFFFIYSMSPPKNNQALRTTMQPPGYL